MEETNQRIAYGRALVDLGSKNAAVVALEADLGKSTMSYLFQEAYPDRYYEMGIAEQGMASTAAGLAQTGMIPFIHSFAVFAAGRAYDQIRQTIAIGKLNVKICGSSAGLSDFGDGATHQSVEDIAIMRAIPNLCVLCPADAIETAKMVGAMAERSGPVYIRLNRNSYPNITKQEDSFRIGVPTLLKDGSEVVIFAMGIMAGKALEAARQLEGQCSVKVVNVSTLKPFPEEVVREYASGCKAVITAEEHSIIGGLGSAVAQALAQSGKPITFIGIPDEFGCSAHGYEELMEHYGLTTKAIEAAVIQLNQKVNQQESGAIK